MKDPVDRCFLCAKEIVFNPLMMLCIGSLRSLLITSSLGHPLDNLGSLFPQPSQFYVLLFEFLEYLFIKLSSSVIQFRKSSSRSSNWAPNPGRDIFLNLQRTARMNRTNAALSVNITCSTELQPRACQCESTRPVEFVHLCTMSVEGYQKVRKGYYEIQ